MEKEKQNISELSKAISKDFSLINSKDLRNYEELKNYLTKEIRNLIDKKYDVLISILYRIDIDSRKIEELFSSENKENIPSGLAELIIERQLQKLKFRRLYKEGKI